MRYDIIFTIIVIIAGLVLIKNVGSTPPPSSELETVFVIKNGTRGLQVFRYEVHYRGTRVGSIHTEQLTPGLYIIEVK
jgi:hypothetical protein